MPRQDLLQVRAGTAAAWTSANPTLAVGEPGLETDTLKVKYGDGVTAWNSLSYAVGGGTGFESHTLTNSVVINGADWDVQFGVNSDGDRVDNFSAYAETFATLLAIVQAQMGTPDASVSVGYDGATPVVEISLPVGGELRIPNLPAGTSASILYLDGNVIKVGAAPSGSGDDKADALITTSTKTANYTLAAGDLTSVNAGEQLVFLMNVASANDFTIPPNSSVAFPVGTVIKGVQYGAGQVTIVPDSGVTMRSPFNANKTYAQYSEFYIEKIGSDEWILGGDITA